MSVLYIAFLNSVSSSPWHQSTFVTPFTCPTSKPLTSRHQRILLPSLNPNFYTTPTEPLSLSFRISNSLSSSSSSSSSSSTPVSTSTSTSTSQPSILNKASSSHPRIAVIGKKFTTGETEVVISSEQVRKGIMGIRANAYWDSIGAVPLIFAGLGILALVIKMVKVKGGQFRNPSAVNRTTIPKSAITSQEQEAELHVFKCGGCGYEMYPARGRENRFFPDSFKCPLCGTPKNQFWDRNDPDDPRNQIDEDEEDDEDGERGRDDDDDDGKDGDSGGEGGGGEGDAVDATAPKVSTPVQMSVDGADAQAQTRSSSS